MRKLPARQCAQALAQLMADTPTASRPKMVKHFWAWLRHRRATKIWPRILVHLQRLDDEQHHRRRVTATVAKTELAAVVTKSLQHQWGAQTAVETIIDPQVIGGIKLRSGDTLYDGTIANSLQHLRSTLTTYHHE